MAKLTDIQKRVDSLLQDASSSLTSDDKDAVIAEAIQKEYSKDRPLELVTDVTSDGTNDLPLPAPNAGSQFEDGFSYVKAIEYPVGLIPESYVDQTDWKMYRSPSALKIRLLGSAPSVSSTARITWTARHLADGSTIFAPDFDAVCCLSAAKCFELLAAKMVQTVDAMVSADAVNYRTKSQEYLTVAKQMRKRYEDHVGVNDGNGSGAGSSQQAALAIGDMHNQMATGLDRITHNKYTR